MLEPITPQCFPDSCQSPSLQVHLWHSRSSMSWARHIPWGHSRENGGRGRWKESKPELVLNETKPIYQTKQERNRDLFLDSASEVSNPAPSLLGPLAHLPPSVHCSILGLIIRCAQGQNTPRSSLVQNLNSSILPFPLFISRRLIKRRKRK